MKNLFAAALALGMMSVAHAQTEKGNWLVNTTFSFEKSTNTYVQPSADVNSFQSLQVQPVLQVGRFVRDRLAVGVQASVLGQSRGTSFAGGAFVRKYWSISPRFAPFLNTYLTYSPNALGFGEPNRELNVGAQLGIAYFSRRAFSLEAKANFLRFVGVYGWNGYGENLTVLADATTFNPSFELGLAWYFGNRTALPTATDSERPRLSRGTRVWGGTFSTQTISTQYLDMASTLSTWQGGPDYAVFVNDDVALGIGLTGGLTRVGGRLNDTQALSWSVGMTPYSRYYRMLNPSLGLFLQGALAVQYSRRVLGDQHTWNGELGVRPGIHYFLGKRWAIEGMAGNVGLTYYNTRNDLTSLESPVLRAQRTLQFSNELGLGNFSVGLKYFVR